ncbi:DUF2971 domain-containing protein [Desulfopila sp. IMCC35006]|uniref:DUF2971 domain-containing protein n=1 Tax=Desulfopila sp. IMCC35006 TaxID=2569542 RepID=UPI0010ACECD1|nr:DUF2971 domain-containing protein [Desulfopila sp. IMCC35006]TKB23853.1 DUF2971 domain-containing protein [Desulfopila sp. IMCC35006]
MRKTPVNFLRRYTNLPSLFDILQNQRITLLDPSTWDDKNDSFFMEKYKDKKGLKTLLGLCFTEKGETYHHWKVFSSGSSGVCVVFKKDELLQYVKNISGTKCNQVSYKRIKQIKDSPPTISEMPFIKRLPYQDEKEFRIIYEHKITIKNHKQISIKLDSIEKITLSPWTPEQLIQPVRQAIKNIADIPVLKTTLLSNEQWKNIGNQIKSV